MFLSYLRLTVHVHDWPFLLLFRMLQRRLRWWVTAWNVTSSDNTPTSLLGLLDCTTNCNVITIDINCDRIQNVYSPTAALFSHAKYTYRLLCCVMRETLESGGGDAGLFGYCVAFPVALCLPAFIEWLTSILARCTMSSRELQPFIWFRAGTGSSVYTPSLSRLMAGVCCVTIWVLLLFSCRSSRLRLVVVPRE